MRSVVISRRHYLELLEQEIPATDAFRDLQLLTIRSGERRFARILSGAARKGPARGAWKRFRRSLLERGARRCPDRQSEIKECIEARARIRGRNLYAGKTSRAALREALAEVVLQAHQRIGLLLLDDPKPRFIDLAEASDEPREQWRKGNNLLAIADDPLPASTDDPPRLFGEEIGAGHDWHLSETVRHLRCHVETPGTGSDDIVLQGHYTYRSANSIPLDIRPDEVDYDTGDVRFYDRRPNTTPHARVTLQEDDVPRLYLSVHVLTEADDWSEIADVIAEFLRDIAQSPISNLAEAAAGQLSITGLAAGASIVGAGLDTAIDNLSDGVLEHFGERVYRFVYELISAIGEDDNIIFEPWLTGIWIRWLPGRSGTRVPVWNARHAVAGRFNKKAEPVSRNPCTGQGILRPGRFAGDNEVFVEPKIYSRDEYSSMTGRYSYMSYVQVIRTEFRN